MLNKLVRRQRKEPETEIRQSKHNIKMETSCKSTIIKNIVKTIKTTSIKRHDK